MAEKYVSMVQDMYGCCRTGVVLYDFKVEVGLYQVEPLLVG